MQIENPLRMVREMKGAPISILMALALVRQRVTQEWIERNTGYTDKPVSQALAYLAEIGFVDHSNAGWQLTGNARQLPLPLVLDENTSAGGQEPEGQAEIVVDEKILPVMSRKVSDSLSSSCSLNINQESESVKTTRRKAPSRNYSDSQAAGPPISELPVDPDDQARRSALLTALVSMGIRDPKRSEILKIPSLTSDIVKSWKGELESRNCFSTGLLITVLLSRDPLPEIDEDVDETEPRYRYAEWEDPARRRKTKNSVCTQTTRRKR